MFPFPVKRRRHLVYLRHHFRFRLEDGGKGSARDTEGISFRQVGGEERGVVYPWVVLRFLDCMDYYGHSSTAEGRHLLSAQQD